MKFSHITGHIRSRGEVQMLPHPWIIRLQTAAKHREKAKLKPRFA